MRLPDDLKNRPPSRYLPFTTGKYDVKPGLHRFATDFGNRQADHFIFQLDCQFGQYRKEKLAARSEQLDRYVLFHEYRPPVPSAVTEFIARRLCDEYPNYFQLQRHANQWQIDCQLTNERLVFDDLWQFNQSASDSRVKPRYNSALDALAAQVQEDMAVTCTLDNRHWMAAMHVCLPSHWSPAEKIGCTFAEIHSPVPGIEPLTERQNEYVDQMMCADQGLVRFVWGLQRDHRLNRHPDLSPRQLDNSAEGQRLNLYRCPPFFRVERQTIWGLPHVKASLFTIRPFLINAAEIRENPTQRRSLLSALETMSDELLAYKELASWRHELTAWLSSADPNK